MSFEDNYPFAAERRFSNSSNASQTSRPSIDQVSYRPDVTDVEESRIHNQHGTTEDLKQQFTKNPNIDIRIIDAGQPCDGSGSHIVYTIQCGDTVVKRRYSEFETLRQCLTRLFPVLVVPCIPEKHSVADYASAPTKAKKDAQVIDHRKRMLAVFLNRCAKIDKIRSCSVFQRFLDPQISWSEVVHSPPISLLPKNILQAPPLAPFEQTADHRNLPTPSASKTTKYQNSESIMYGQMETDAKDYEGVATNWEKVNQRIIKRFTDISQDQAELGALYNAFSLSQSSKLAAPIERVGQAIDSNFLATEELIMSLSTGFAEPVSESVQLAQTSRQVLKYRRQKSLQLQITEDTLQQKHSVLKELEQNEAEAKRIENYFNTENTDDTKFPPTHASQHFVKKSSSNGGFNMFKKLGYALHSIIDVDPETMRRNNIGKTRELIEQLEGTITVAKQDVSEANHAVKEDVNRFRNERLADLTEMMISFGQSHVVWARKNLDSWQEARTEVDRLKM